MYSYTIIILLVLIMLALPSPSIEESNKIDTFIKQYHALKEEMMELWGFVQKADLSKTALLLSRQEEFSNLRKRIYTFSAEVREYDLQRQKEALHKGVITGRAFEEHPRFYALSRAADIMCEILIAGGDYLFEKKAVYLKVALKYEEILKLFEEEALQQ